MLGVLGINSWFTLLARFYTAQATKTKSLEREDKKSLRKVSSCCQNKSNRVLLVELGAPSDFLFMAIIFQLYVSFIAEAKFFQKKCHSRRK